MPRRISTATCKPAGGYQALMMPFPISKATVNRSSPKFKHMKTKPAPMFQGFVGKSQRSKTLDGVSTAWLPCAAFDNFDSTGLSFKSAPSDPKKSHDTYSARRSGRNLG